MRKAIYLAVMAAVCLFTSEGYGQLSRRSIKKNNRQLSTYRGDKFHFGKDKTYNAIGFSVNALNYYGDLAPKPNRFSTDISFTRPAFAVSYAHRFGPRYTLVGAFMYGTLSGSDTKSADEGDAENAFFRYQRNLSFRNRIKELSLIASFDLFENSSSYLSRVAWTPYAFVGVAVFHHNPQAQVPATQVDGITPFSNAGEWVNLRPLGTEGQNANLLPTDANAGIKSYNLIQPAIPFGVGVRFRVNTLVDIAAEFGFRYLFTDYIDDVSQSYVDLGVFGDNELAKAMSYRTFELPQYNPAVNPSILHAYTGRDNRQYMALPGYGEEFKNDVTSNIRGNKNDKDIYTVFTIRGTYIIGKSIHRAKFR
ncbi:DUF6089 family protein [Chryseosolibacter indicus]|uniref:DUF6089 domain-containing protein n=1 Tax=Chryseosolibacter indicus TaxID=2782351 RepID=A0ABS5VX73_9BACT|nr:DUF6089 family protein [Chryseosolibacter indicus]MBT1706007.1 hypothetical protein [Chryseosolibacter indicus]